MAKKSGTMHQGRKYVGYCVLFERSQGILCAVAGGKSAAALFHNEESARAYQERFPELAKFKPMVIPDEALLELSGDLGNGDLALWLNGTFSFVPFSTIIALVCAANGGEPERTVCDEIHDRYGSEVANFADAMIENDLGGEDGPTLQDLQKRLDVAATEIQEMIDKLGGETLLTAEYDG